MKNPKVVYELPYPPTVNTYYRSVLIPSKSGGKGHVQVKISKRGRQYREAVQLHLSQCQVLTGRLAVTVFVWFPDLRERDLDNLLKPLLDACTKAGLWESDKQIKRLTIEARGIRRPDGVVVLQANELDAKLF